MGIGDWGLGPIPNPQSPIPNPQSPLSIIFFHIKYIYAIYNKIIFKLFIKQNIYIDIQIIIKKLKKSKIFIYTLHLEK